MHEPGAASAPRVPASDAADAAGSILALDYGEKRIGVAVGDAAIGIAHPLQHIAFEDNRRRLEAIERLVREWQPRRIVMGIPDAEPGSDHPIARSARRFARRLSARFGLPVDLIDEHLSSWEASRRLTSAGVRARSQKAHIDALAACVILDRWFEQRAADPAHPGKA